jgi:hypothetical protein
VGVFHTSPLFPLLEPGRISENISRGRKKMGFQGSRRDMGKVWGESYRIGKVERSEGKSRKKGVR